jgi:hypothetical protein
LSAAGRRTRACRAALVLVFAAVSAVAGATSAPAVAADPERLPLRVVISEISPRVPKPGDTLTVRGEVVNPSDEPYDDVSVRLRLSPTALYNRTEIGLVSEAAPRLRDGLPVPGTLTEIATRLDGQGRAGFSLSAPVDELDLPVNGVYVVGVEALGIADGAASDEALRIGLQKTFLPWMPRTNLYVPTRLSLLWPLMSLPARDANGRLTGRTLPDQLAAGGRLSTLLRGVGATPVTWVVDPDLLDSAATMTGAASTATATAGPATSPPATEAVEPGAGANAAQAQAAAEWLAAARRTLQGDPLVAAPYADVDVQALTRAGWTHKIDEAIRGGAQVLPQVLGRAADSSLAWPADGFAESQTLARLRDGGARTFVLDSRAVTATETLDYTPTGRAGVDTELGRFDVLVTDNGLTQALSGDLAGPDQGTLAAQRFLAETAMITAERPNMARSVLAAPPRRWSPSAPWLQRLLIDLRQAPWVQLAGLDELHRTDVPPQLDGAALAYPEDAAAVELSPAQVSRARDAERSADRLIELLTRPERRLSSYQTAALGALSSAWREFPRDGERFVDRFARQIRQDSEKVRIIGLGLVTLSSTSGTIPITISNELDEPVVVGLGVTPKVPSRLQVAEPEPVTIGARRKTTIEVGAHASANGMTRVDVQLLTPSGAPYGPVVAARVNATNYGTVGLVVVIAAAGALFAAAALRNVRRFRAAQRHKRGAGSHAGAGRASTATDEKIQA